MTAVLRSLVPAVIGGVIVAVALLAFDDEGGGGNDGPTTVVQQVPLRSAAASRPEQGLTARDIYKRDAPGVVLVRATVVEKTASPFGLPEEQRGQATGSGFVIDSDGLIMTNAHVVGGAREVTVSFQDEKTEQARVVGRDVSNDLALLRVDPDGASLKPLQLGDSGSIEVGDPTLAIGNPFGRERTLTTGVVSALQRRIQAPNSFQIDNVIQTDAAINPGNSGGPLLDAAGRVIGINSQIETGGGGGGFVGIGFAVPINTAKEVLPQLEKGSVRRAFLGIEGTTIDSSLAKLNLAARSGVLVQQVTPGSPADRAGIEAGDVETQSPDGPIVLGGDVITAVDGRRIRSMDDVVAAVSDKKPGERIRLDVMRDGRRRAVDVTLGTRPNAAPQG